MISFAPHAEGPYLSQTDLAPDIAEMECVYTRAMAPGSMTERIIGGFAPLVASGSLSLSEAVDAMAGAYLAMGKPLDRLDAAVDRLTRQLADAIERGPIVAATPRPDMHPLVARGLGIERGQPVSQDELTGLLAGRQASGAPIEGKRYHPSSPIGAYDFAVTAPKSTSIAWAFAPPIERAMIATAHTEAAREGVARLVREVGQARYGRGGQGGMEPGHVGWIEFQHHTARPTRDAPGDPDVHTHFAVPNAVFTESGRVGSLHTQRVKSAIFVGDARYTARLGENLRAQGFDATDKGEMPAVPERVREHFSKRSNEGREQARERAESRGAKVTARWVKSSVQHPSQRRGKEGLADCASWFAQGVALGWEPKSLMAYGVVREVGRQVGKLAPAMPQAPQGLLASMETLRKVSVAAWQQFIYRTPDPRPVDPAFMAAPVRSRGGIVAEPWMMREGGFEALSAGHKASAERSYETWRTERNPKAGAKCSLEDYVGYVQRKWAESNRPTAFAMAREDRGVPRDMGQFVVERARDVKRSSYQAPPRERLEPRLTIPL